MTKILMMVVGVLLFSTQLLAQTRSISGTVLDNNGQPLPGVTVRAVGERTGTVTDSRGFFTITVPQGTRNLEFSYVGYTTQTVSIPDTGNITATLQQAETAALNEVVVTGYTRQKRAEFSGAGTKVTSEQVNSIPMGSFDQILQGRSPGLLVTAGSGQPGAAARVQIRGQSSITGGSNPLYVLDGVPIESSVFQALNPNDFESVDVLRDASATSLYGNRGGSGVIVITTKKGRAGKTEVAYLGQVGMTQRGKQNFDMLNTSELLQFQENLGRQDATFSGLPGWFYSKNNPRYATLTPAEQTATDRALDSLRGIDTDWRDVFFRTGSFHSHDLNISGGAGKTRFFSSLGFYKEEGIGFRSDMKRFSFRTNLDHQTDKLTAGINAYAGYTFRNIGEAEGQLNTGNPNLAAYFALPYHRLNNQFSTVDTGTGKFGGNAYDRIVSASNKADQLKTNLNLTAGYEIIRNITLGGFFGLDFRETLNERAIYPRTYFSNNQAFPLGPPNGAGTGMGGGQFGENTQRFSSLITRGSLGYRNMFVDRHSVDATAFVEFNREYTRNFNYIGYGTNPALLNTPGGITAGNITNKLVPVVGGNRTSRSFFALMGILKYNFADKYTVNLSLRRDGTSILPTQNRFENFYAAGVTWNVLKETFASDWGWTNDLRVRASYGQAANAENFPLGNFGYLPTYAGTATYIGSGTESTIVAPNNAGNPEAQWEKISTLNLGVDFGLLRNRINGSLDVYNKITENNIVTQQLSRTSGFNSQLINAAKIGNKGIELALNSDLVRARDFTWSVGANLAYNKNEVLDLGQTNQFELGTSLVKEGLSLGQHYDVKWAGVDPSTGQPLYYDRDGKITTKYDFTTMAVAEFGSYNAPFIGGFNTGIRAFGFNLSAFFTFQQGFFRYNNQSYFIENPQFSGSQNQSRELLTMWSKPGDITNIQSPVYARQFSSKDIEDASYLRFRNLNLSYDIGKGAVNSLRAFSGIRIFVQAQNLYTWTHWTGFDPEDANNIATFEYPAPRTFTLGLDFNFK